MTDLTPREILEAFRRGLEETARRFAGGKGDGSGQLPRPHPPTDPGDDRGPIPREEKEA
jgi:hypothetical protein